MIRCVALRDLALVQRVRIFAFWACIVVPVIAWSQSEGLFDRDEVITLTLSGSLVELLKDRTGEPRYFEVTLAYPEVDGRLVSLPVRARTRGNFRRMSSNCEYPPLLLNFSRAGRKNTLFEAEDKLKLVMPCRGDQYVVREYLVYRLYNLVTPKSFKARLVSVVLDDPSLKARQQVPFYGILLEAEEHLTGRHDMISIERQLIKPERLQTDDFLKLAVFQYLIGNTDWSVQYRQNIKLMAADTLSRPIAVPYDFDHAGIVGAPYARPAEALALSSTRHRRYRGFCISDMVHYQNVIAHFNTLKPSLYAVYENNPLVDEAYKKSTLKFLDEFYKIINDPKRVKEEFQYPCRSDGTGNVVIKGLNKN